MQLLNLKTSLTAPEGPVTESAKHSPDTDLTGISAQFSGLLNTAMQEKVATPLPNTPPAPAPQSVGEDNKLQDAPLQEPILDATLPTVEESGKEPQATAKSPFFPLNIIATLQSLLNPQGTEKPSTEKSVQGNTNSAEPQSSEILPEANPPSPQTTVETKGELPVSTEVKPQPTQTVIEPKTDVQIANGLQNNFAEKNLEIAVAAPEANSVKSAVSTPAEKPLKSPTEKKSEKSGKTTAKEEANQPQASVSVQNIPVEVLSLGSPVPQGSPQGLPQDLLQTQLTSTNSIQSVTENSAPYSQQIPQSNVFTQNSATMPANNPQIMPSPASFSNPNAVPANAPEAPSVANAQETAPLPQAALEAPTTLQTEDPISLSTAIPSEALPLDPQIKINQKESATAPQIPATVTSAIGGKNTDNNQNIASATTTSQNTQTPASLNTLQDIGNKLNAMKGQIESSRSDSDELKKDDLSDVDSTITDSAPSPLLTHIPLEHTAQATNTNTVSTDAKLPTFVPSAIHPADQVVEGTAYSVKNGHQELVIRLNPDNLGEVRVNLSTSGKDGLSARLIASSSESQEVLQSHLTHLKTSLEAQGVQLDRLSVVIADNTESSGSHMDQQSQQHHFHQQDSQQQQMTQQDFNQQQNQSNAQMAFNLNQQGSSHASKSAYAQAPSDSSSSRQEPTGSSTVENTSNQKRNDDGKISILA